MFNLLLRVNDNGLPFSRTTITAVNITIVDVNDNAPVFLQPVYSFTVPIDAGPGVVGAVQATDLDSDTILGGNNSEITYSLVVGPSTNCTSFLEIDSITGEVSVTQALNRTIDLFCVLQVQASNEGNETTPATALVSLRFVNNNFAVSITVDANIHDFRRQSPNATCLQDLEPVIGGTVTILHTFASALSPDLRTEVVFYAENAAGHTLDATDVTRALLQNSGALGQLQCSGWDESIRSDSGHDVGIAFYEDANCLRPYNWSATGGVPLSALNDTFVFESYGAVGSPHQCLSAQVSGFSARVSCAGLPTGNASVRIFDSDDCAPPTFVAVGTDVNRDGGIMDNYECSLIEPFSAGSTNIYTRVFCEDIIITSTTTTTSSVTTRTTVSSVTSTITSSTVTSTVTTPTVTSVTQTTTTSTVTGDLTNFGAGGSQSSSAGFPLWIVIGCALAVLLCWVVALIFVVRHRKRKEAETLVTPAFPVSGDVFTTSGDDTAIQGGMVTDEGTVRMFGEGEEDAAMHNVRFNPMTALADLQHAGLMDEDDNDSLGDLSDFDEADFEEFADSLLQTEGADDELFGQLAPAASSAPAPKRVSFDVPKKDNRYSTALPGEDELTEDDDLSDFENDEDSDDDTNFTDKETNRRAGHRLRPHSFVMSSLPEDAATTVTPQQHVQPAQFAASETYGGSIGSRASREIDAIAMVANVEYSDISQNIMYN